jgi:hypothetical protein
MATLEARLAPTWGTLAELNASTIILRRGERWFRTDAPVVTDPSNPFDGLPNPAMQWKTGDGTKRFNQIANYDPIGVGGTSSGPGVVEIDPHSVLANLTAEPGAGTSLRITLQPGDDPDTTDTLLSELGIGDTSGFSNMLGTVSVDEVATGGLRGVFDRFAARAATPPITVTGNITNGSATVTLGSPLDPRIGSNARVFVLAGGTGIASPAYINAVATDRLSFALTSSMFVLTPGAGAPLLATQTGSRSLEIRDPNANVFGMNIDGILKQSVYNGLYDWRSTPNALQTNTITGETTQSRVKDGVLSWRAAQVNGGAWEQITGATDLLLITRQVVAPVGPSSHHTWATLPAAGTAGAEFLSETNGRHRFKLVIPDDFYTQFLLGMDNLIVAGTNVSTMWVEFLDPADSIWKDITTARVTVSLNTPIDVWKESAVGTLHAAAKTAAAASPSRSVWCRIMGTTTGAATGNPQFTSVWTLLK